MKSSKNSIDYLGYRWLVENELKSTLNGMWLSPELDSGTHNNSMRIAPVMKLYRSANRGVAGVVYVLSKLHRFGYNHPNVKEQINKAVDWLLDHEPTPDDQLPGLHFGEAGVAVAICEAINSGLVDRGEWLMPYLNEALLGPIDWPDLTHGAAGQGIASLICSDLLKDPRLQLSATRCFEYILSTQEDDGSWILPEGVPSLKGATYTGFAHGVAGVVYFLSKYAHRFNSPEAKAAAIKGGVWLQEQGQKSKFDGTLWWPMFKGKTESWRWWCHGGPGISQAFNALFQLTGNEDYLEIIRSSLRAHSENVRYNNMSQCHGLSGLGEILLDAYHLLKEPEWLNRAQRIGSSLNALAKIDSQGASWLVENPFIPTADLMIGCGGVTHFLARLAAEDSSFGSPLMV